MMRGSPAIFTRAPIVRFCPPARVASSPPSGRAYRRSLERCHGAGVAAPRRERLQSGPAVPDRLLHVACDRDAVQHAQPLPLLPLVLFEQVPPHRGRAHAAHHTRAATHHTPVTLRCVRCSQHSAREQARPRRAPVKDLWCSGPGSNPDRHLNPSPNPDRERLQVSSRLRHCRRLSSRLRVAPSRPACCWRVRRSRRASSASSHMCSTSSTSRSSTPRPPPRATAPSSSPPCCSSSAARRRSTARSNPTRTRTRTRARARARSLSLSPSPSPSPKPKPKPGSTARCNLTRSGRCS